MQRNRKNRTWCSILFWALLSNAVWSQYPTVRERVVNLPNFDERFVHYGYYVGLNQYDFKFEYTEDYYRVNNYPDIEVLPKRGFSIGLIGDMRINKFINLRLEPGLYYNQRDLIFPVYVGVESEIERTREVKSTYIHLPFYVKINAERINNFRPFILFGVSTDFNLSSNYKNTDDNTTGVFRTVNQLLNYELGLGFEFYLYYFKFSPSIRGSLSMENELIPDNDPNSPWTRNINNIFSRGVALIITFE